MFVYIAEFFILFKAEMLYKILKMEAIKFDFITIINQNDIFLIEPITNSIDTKLCSVFMCIIRILQLFDNFTLAAAELSIPTKDVAASFFLVM